MIIGTIKTNGKRKLSPLVNDEDENTSFKTVGEDEDNDEDDDFED